MREETQSTLLSYHLSMAKKGSSCVNCSTVSKMIYKIESVYWLLTYRDATHLKNAFVNKTLRQAFIYVHKYIALKILQGSLIVRWKPLCPTVHNFD